GRSFSRRTVVEAERFESAAAGAVVLDREYRADLRSLPLELDLLEDHGELVAATEVAREIEVPLEDFGQRVRELGWRARGGDRALERAVEPAADRTHGRLAGVLVEGRRPGVVRARECELTAAFERELEAIEPPRLGEVSAPRAPSAQLARIGVTGGGAGRGL